MPTPHRIPRQRHADALHAPLSRLQAFAADPGATRMPCGESIVWRGVGTLAGPDAEADAVQAHQACCADCTSYVLTP